MEGNRCANCHDAGRRCLLVGASTFDADSFFRILRPDDVIVAVDGGYASLSAAGVSPAVAIGDFDSLGHRPDCPTVIEHPVMKDDSDFGLALSWAADGGFSDVVAFGVLGGRLDHTVASLQTMHAAALRGLRVSAIGEGNVVVILNGGSLALPPIERGTLSVFSLSDVSRGVSELGLLYGLDDAELTNTVSLGLSNEFIGEPSCISVESGTLAVFLPTGILERL